MKFKSSDKKPWEKISLDQIQPYPSKYNKAIVIAYLFAFSSLFIQYMNVNSILESFMPLIKFVVNGAFALVIMKVVFRQANKNLIEDLLFILPIYTVVIGVPTIVIYLLAGVPFSNIYTIFDPFTLFYGLIKYLYILFGLVGWYMAVYFSMSEHPKIQRHGFTIGILLIFYVVYGIFG